jgi:hypothetical protein
VKVVRILGVVFGALFLLTGVALLVGAAIFGAGQGEFDRQLAEKGLAGPANGRVVAIDGASYTVDYTDKNGASQTGTGPVAEGTTPPGQGDDVQVYYSTLDPGQIIILDFPGGNFAGVAGLLRTVAIVCLVIGAVLLVAGIISLVTGRRRTAALAAGGGGQAAVPPPPGQASGQDLAPEGGGPMPPAGGSSGDPSAPAPASTAPPGPDIDPTPTQPFPGSPQDPTPPAPEYNRPGG